MGEGGEKSDPICLPGERGKSKGDGGVSWVRLGVSGAEERKERTESERVIGSN